MVRLAGCKLLYYTSFTFLADAREHSVQDLPTSRGLCEEMVKITQQHVEHVSSAHLASVHQFSSRPFCPLFHPKLKHTHPFNGPLSGTRKAKPIWILLKQETVSGSGISRAVCKSAPRSRQITMPAPHHSVFTGRMPFLPPNQQRQSTEEKTPQA